MPAIDLDATSKSFTEWFERWAAFTAVTRPEEAPTGWTQTHKLRVTGDGHRDRLVAARLNLRSER